MFLFSIYYDIINKVIEMAKSVKKTNINNDNEIGKLIKMVIIVTVIFGIFYFITYLITKKDIEDEQTNNATKAEIQYDKILISGVLSQEYDNYYVLIYDTDDYNYSVYDIYLSKYSQMADALRVYKAELNNPLNASFVSEEAKLKVSNIKKLKVSETTLLKIKKGKVDKYYVGDNIKEHLIKLTTEE